MDVLYALHSLMSLVAQNTMRAKMTNIPRWTPGRAERLSIGHNELGSALANELLASPSSPVFDRNQKPVSYVSILPALVYILSVYMFVNSPSASEFFHRVDPAGPTFRDHAHRYVSVLDLNDDGFADLIYGNQILRFVEPNPPNPAPPSPLRVLLSNGDGTFRKPQRRYLPGRILVNYPISLTDDFDGDGRLDIALFDEGNGTKPFLPCDVPRECGIAFIGGVPRLLLRNARGSFRSSDTFALASKAAKIPPFSGPSFHIKNAASADIDNDGDKDLYVETKGAFANYGRSGYFLVNQGNGKYDLEARASDRGIGGPGGSLFAYDASALADFNGDGFHDLMLGHVWRSGKDGQANLLVLNDGRGFFPAQNVIKLPTADFNGDFVSVRAILVFDVNSDGFLDAVLAHRRSCDLDCGPRLEGTGRHIQIIINDGAGRFRDETKERLPNQSRTERAASRIFSGRKNDGLVRELHKIDFNLDGHLDIVAARATGNGFVTEESPLVYLNDGEGFFKPLASSVFKDKGMRWESNGIPVYLNNDGVIDFVAIAPRPGRDGEFFTLDETNHLVALVSQKVYGTGPGGVEPALAGAPGYNEQFYLRKNADVRRALEAGLFVNGLEHYLKIGLAEDRPGMAPGTVFRGSGRGDVLRGLSGDEKAFGLGGDDRFFGRGGNDLFVGGGGDDWAAGGGGDDDLRGGVGLDTLAGGHGDDLISGGDGNDILIGGDGDDTLTGGGGRDVLSGGPGKDVFRFVKILDSRAVGPDLIKDFGSGDLIDLSRISANLDGTEFRFVERADFSGRAGELRYTKRTGLLSGDLNGDKIADLQIQLKSGVMVSGADIKF